MPFDSNLSLPIPERFLVTQDESGFCVRWKWFRWTHIFLLVFCFFWFGFLAAWYGTMLGFSRTDESPLELVFLFFPLLHVGVGFLMLYGAITGFFNSTEVFVGSGILKIRHFPLPWLGNATLDGSTLKQLTVQKKVRRTKNGTHVRFVLYAIDHENKSKKIISNAGQDETIFLEHFIEKHLGIVNQSVLGEFRPS